MKRKFSSYGPVELKSEYYVPRTELLNRAINQLLGENIDEGGHYFTVWAPRQNGKSWLLRQTMFELKKDDRFYVAKVNLESLKEQSDELYCCNAIIREINSLVNINILPIDNLEGFKEIFTEKYFKKPVILIFDEFDALYDNVISAVVSKFRDIFLKRKDDSNPYNKKQYLLHGLALIGVRSVLGIENAKGSPFNVQRSLHVPNLTFEEVQEMYRWYEKESGQPVEQEVIDKIYYETAGHPGLVSWFGELLTETYNETPDKPLTMDNLNLVIRKTRVIPSNTLTNLISKAKNPEHKPTLFELFRTNEKMDFSFHKPHLNYLFMNGLITYDKDDNVRFSCPFVQRHLFDYFSDEVFEIVGRIFKPFEETDIYFNDNELFIKNILRKFETYQVENKDWLYKQAPRRYDMKLYEAVYHFNLFRFLCNMLERKKVKVFPEFPTGNGKIDLLLKHNEKTYGIELKTFADTSDFKDCILQAARYAKQMKLSIITLCFFVDAIDDASRNKYEKTVKHEETGVDVEIVFVKTLE